jgi:hypothetical protein
MHTMVRSSQRLSAELGDNRGVRGRTLTTDGRPFPELDPVALQGQATVIVRPG